MEDEDMEIEPYVRNEGDDDEIQEEDENVVLAPQDIIIQLQQIQPFQIVAFYTQILYMHGFIPLPFESMIRECNSIDNHEEFSKRKPLEKTRLKRWRKSLGLVIETITVLEGLLSSSAPGDITDILLIFGATTKISKMVYRIRLNWDCSLPRETSAQATDASTRAFLRQMVANLAPNPLSTKVFMSGRLFLGCITQPNSTLPQSLMNRFILKSHPWPKKAKPTPLIVLQLTEAEAKPLATSPTNEINHFYQFERALSGVHGSMFALIGVHGCRFLIQAAEMPDFPNFGTLEHAEEDD